MRRCCPVSCKKENPENTLKFTEDDCNKFPGDGTCTYPNKAQCPDGKLHNVLLIFKRILELLILPYIVL